MFNFCERKEPESPKFEIEGGELIEMPYQIYVDGRIVGEIRKNNGEYCFISEVHRGSFAYSCGYVQPINGETFDKINEKLKELNAK